MQLFDSHCHLDLAEFDKDRDQVVQRAREAGVEKILIPGCDLKSAKKAVALADAISGCYAAVGVHPHDASGCSDQVMAELKGLTAHPKVKAIGETGLDFNRMYSPAHIQEKWFERQMALARDTGLPLIFHERDSKGRFLEMLVAHIIPGQKGVVHCFSGNKKELSAYLDLGFFIGVTGIATMKKRGKPLRDLIPLIPLDRLVIETDAPYLTPAPEKNKTRRNEPAFVGRVLSTAAKVLNRKEEDLAGMIWGNTLRLYAIDEDSED